MRNDELNIINPNKVSSNGMYVTNNGKVVFLSFDEVAELREKHDDAGIAEDLDIPSFMKDSNRRTSSRYDSSRSTGARVGSTNRSRTTNSRRSNSRRNYNLKREQPYAYRKSNLFSVLRKYPRVALVCGAVILIIVGGIIHTILNSNDNEFIYPDSVPGVSTEDDISVIIMDEYSSIPTLHSANDNEVIEELSNRKQMIKDICDVYQVNYDVVYSFLCDYTENFSSIDYLGLCMDDVTCKGAVVNPRTEEELLVYIIRTIKQNPSKWNIDTSNLYINNGYQSGTDYCEQIEHVSEVLGVDKHLMYAIVQSECGFDSELFNNSNNPAGILGDNGNWWIFDTKEEGFYELGMEIIKYYRLIGENINDLSPDVIEKIRDIHAPLSDGNEHWLPNVLNRLEYAQNNSDELFGADQNKGVNR